MIDCLNHFVIGTFHATAGSFRVRIMKICCRDKSPLAICWSRKPVVGHQTMGVPSNPPVVRMKNST